MTSSTGSPRNPDAPKSVRRRGRGMPWEMATVPSVTSTSKCCSQRLGRWMSRAYTVDIDENGLKEIRDWAERPRWIFCRITGPYLDPIIIVRS